MKNCFLPAAIASLAFMSGPTASAQTPSGNNDAAIETIIKVGTTDNKVMDHLDILTNRFGGRLIGSDAYDNAVDWMLHEYAKWGVKAWTEEAGQVPVGFNRGPWFGRLLGADEPMQLHFATPSYTSGTRGIERGHVVIDPRSQAELNRMKHKLKGAWVLIPEISDGFPINKSARGDSIREAARAENAAIQHYNDSLRRVSYETGAKYEPKPLRNDPAIFYREMLEAGVRGFVRKARVPIRALYDRPLVNDTTTTFDNLPHQAEIFLDEHQFDKIYQMAKERRDIELEFDVRNHFKLGPVKYSSVIAEIPGTEFPDEYVIISGHLDAYDVATGGVDCGVGITPMMEAARLLALSGAKPRRTIRFVAFAGEEFGLLGAKAYAKAHADELPRISMLINRDGGPTPPVGMRVPAAMVEDIKTATAAISRINSEYPFEVTVAEPVVKPTRTGGTDATVFAIEGVPTYGFITRDFKGYDFDYGEIWHTERDVYNKEIPEYQEYTAVATALAALGIADLDTILSREGMFKDPAPEKKGNSKKGKKDSAKKKK
ncbi:MAG: M20/M25/M40 family metallo-hydrolase [Bacteroides sp.]|nr:M20/M25/M40 family metallo-hydrolase [Bacteroides sp.]